jgi:hypothetical protein
MSESNDLANLETPITGEVPDDAVNDLDVASDGGSGPSTEEQIISDADLTDVPEADLNTDIPEPNSDFSDSTQITENTYGMHEVDPAEQD